jgi:hypothetical protein
MLVSQTRYQLKIFGEERDRTELGRKASADTSPYGVLHPKLVPSFVFPSSFALIISYFSRFSPVIYPYLSRREHVILGLLGCGLTGGSKHS